MDLIFFDIDGTLATGSAIPESAKKAIQQLRAQGDLVFICTGRPRGYAENLFNDYADGFICSNGRLAFKGDETLFDDPLTQRQIQDITARLDEMQAGYVFWGERDAYHGGDPSYYEQMRAMLGPDHPPKGLGSAEGSLYSFDVHFKDKAHREQIEKALEGICLLNPHGPMPHADVTVLGADKGTAIRHVACRLGIPVQDTYAFGDGVNDICMIEAAGHGVAMGNAVEALKERAEYVTTSIDEDGVWNGLRHYHLI